MTKTNSSPIQVTEADPGPELQAMVSAATADTGSELSAKEADNLAGAGIGWNHNQNIAASNPGDHGEAPWVRKGAPAGEAVELLPEGAECVTGAGLPPHIEPNHNQNVAACGPVGAEESPSVPKSADTGSELSTEEADNLAGAGLGWNHNQNIAAASPDGGAETPSTPKGVPAREAVELLPEEAERLTGAGLPRVQPNHNQNVAACGPVGAEESPSVAESAAVGEVIELLPEDADKVVGAGTYLNHNQSVAGIL